MGGEISRRRFLRGAASTGVAVPLSGALGACNPPPDNPIEVENSNAGTAAWYLSNPADDVGMQVKGYASATSVNVGENVDLLVSVDSPGGVQIDVFRLGYYGGNRARLMLSDNVPAITQPAPTLDPTTGEVRCDWAMTYVLPIGADWTSGAYLIRLTNDAGFDNYVPLTVRDDSRTPAFMFQQPVTTYQAYNNFPDDGVIGKSLYDYNSHGADVTPGHSRADTVTFDRPLAGAGSGLVLDFEIDLIAFLESEGYDLGYSTNLDTHRTPTLPGSATTWISAGHDEYWTAEMYDAVEAARDGGTNLAFFGSNAVFWSIELQSAPTGPHRRVHTPKDWNADRWREMGRPEQELIGVQFVSPNEYPNTDYIVTNGSDPVWAGTGLGNGSVVPNITGYEIDHLDPAHPGPNGVQRLLSASPFAGNIQQTSIYTAPSGATVFGSGTMSWAWALGRAGYESDGIKQATRNILGPA